MSYPEFKRISHGLTEKTCQRMTPDIYRLGEVAARTSAKMDRVQGILTYHSFIFNNYDLKRVSPVLQPMSLSQQDGDFCDLPRVFFFKVAPVQSPLERRRAASTSSISG